MSAEAAQASLKALQKEKARLDTQSEECNASITKCSEQLTKAVEARDAQQKVCTTSRR